MLAPIQDWAVSSSQQLVFIDIPPKLAGLLWEIN